jgi:hypothetical protein
MRSFWPKPVCTGNSTTRSSRGRRSRFRQPSPPPIPRFVLN